MTGFLIEYHRPSGDWSLQSFSGENGYRRAMEDSFMLERARRSEEFEVAALASDSVETLKSTHSRYFRGTERQPGFSSKWADSPAH